MDELWISNDNQYTLENFSKVKRVHVAFPDMKLFMAMCKYLVSNTLSKYVFNRKSRKDEKFNIVFDQLIVDIDEFFNSTEI